jgi:hypothetical protein
MAGMAFSWRSATFGPVLGSTLAAGQIRDAVVLKPVQACRDGHLGKSDDEVLPGCDADAVVVLGNRLARCHDQPR